MGAQQHFWKRGVTWLAVFLLLSACVDSINFDIPELQFQTVVEGMITDQPGPYTVLVSKTISLDADSAIRVPIRNLEVKLFDDMGNNEKLTETTPGTYKTGGTIQGQVGHSYHITLKTANGRIFESAPDTIRPVGDIEKIEYEYEAKMVQKGFGLVPADVFNVYFDADAGNGTDNFVRWRFTGTYQAIAYPQFHSIFSEGSGYIDPLPCSGWVVEPALGGGKLVQVGDCTCCTCWVNQYEKVPLVSDGQFVTDHQYKHVKVAEVPINNITFYEKYLVVVDQMSLSEKSFEYFKLIRAQSNDASSLFQPPSAQINGNMSSTNSIDQILGLFWATSIKSKYVFIQRSEVPYELTPIDGVYEACNTYYPNSSLDKPAIWQ